MEEKRLRKLAGLTEGLNETLTTKDFRDLAVIFGSAATDNLSVKVMTQVVKNFMELAKTQGSGFNEDRFITLLRRESPRLVRSLKGEKEPEDSETNEAELNEAQDLSLTRGITADRFSDLAREIERSVSFAGGSFDPDSDAFDKSLEKKALLLMKKLQQKADDVRKIVKQLSKLG